jgi:hypothetical protein
MFRRDSQRSTMARLVGDEDDQVPLEDPSRQFPVLAQYSNVVVLRFSTDAAGLLISPRSIAPSPSAEDKPRTTASLVVMPAISSFRQRSIRSAQTADENVSVDENKRAARQRASHLDIRGPDVLRSA